jgi:hypothetical protein
MANIIAIFIPDLFHCAIFNPITTKFVHIDGFGFLFDFFVASIGVVGIALMTTDSLKFVSKYAIERCSSRFGNVDCAVDLVGMHVSSRCKKWITSIFGVHVPHGG